MANKKTSQGNNAQSTGTRPMVAATLAGVIYQAKLLNRQSKLNIPEHEVVADVVNIWHEVMDALGRS